MTKLFKNEYIIREAKGGHVPPVPPPLDPPLPCISMLQGDTDNQCVGDTELSPFDHNKKMYEGIMSYPLWSTNGAGSLEAKSDVVFIFRKHEWLAM